MCLFISIFLYIPICKLTHNYNCIILILQCKKLRANNLPGVKQYRQTVVEPILA